MSMTREEIIKELEKTVAGAEILTSLGYEEVNEYLDIFKVALSALHPVSREQVEQVWRGCEKCNGAGEYSRYAENLTKILLAKYCPHCGRPLTDEAVDMVMEKMEALHAEN